MDDDDSSESDSGNEYSVSPERNTKTMASMTEEQFMRNRERSCLLLMRARRPTYQSFTRSYFLNFDGRVTKSSKKNL